MSWMPFAFCNGDPTIRQPPPEMMAAPPRLGAFLEGDGARSCIAGLDAGRHTGAARADDGDVGLALPDT